MDWALLGGIPEADVQRLLAIARRRTFRRGEVVFHMGDPADTLHLIAAGRFAVRVQTALADVAILTVLGAGQLFGELALLEPDAHRSATVEALEPGETRSVHRPDFEELRRRHPQVSDVLIAILAGQVQRLSRQLLEALYMPWPPGRAGSAGSGSGRHPGSHGRSRASCRRAAGRCHAG